MSDKKGLPQPEKYQGHREIPQSTHIRFEKKRKHTNCSSSTQVRLSTQDLRLNKGDIQGEKQVTLQELLYRKVPYEVL